MNKTVILFCVVFLFVQCTKGGPPSDKEQIKMEDTSTYISDLVLIYQGGTHRLDWTKDQLKPFIFQEVNGQLDFLFDGFLFIEFKDNLGAEYAPGYQERPAGKASWSFLLERNFEKGKAIHALESTLDSLSKIGKEPFRKRKVYLTLPDPIIGFKDWGRLEHSSLDFDKTEDRITASKWYIDEALKKWKSGNFKHISLAGFYWVAENSEGSANIIPEISKYIKEKELQLSWIPYHHAQGAGDWKSLGFDIAYQQPNYFFNLNTPYSTLTDALDFAKNHDMALEIEFDERLLKDDQFLQRYHDYINEFENYGVWKSLPVAYYQSDRAWLDMANSKDSKLKEAFKRLAAIVIERQERTDKDLGFTK